MKITNIKEAECDVQLDIPFILFILDEGSVREIKGDFENAYVTISKCHVKLTRICRVIIIQKVNNEINVYNLAGSKDVIYNNSPSFGYSVGKVNQVNVYQNEIVKLRPCLGVDINVRSYATVAYCNGLLALVSKQSPFITEIVNESNETTYVVTVLKSTLKMNRYLTVSTTPGMIQYGTTTFPVGTGVFDCIECKTINVTPDTYQPMRGDWVTEDLFEVIGSIKKIIIDAIPDVIENFVTNTLWKVNSGYSIIKKDAAAITLTDFSKFASFYCDNRGFSFSSDVSLVDYVLALITESGIEYFKFPEMPNFTIKLPEVITGTPKEITWMQIKEFVSDTLINLPLQKFKLIDNKIFFTGSILKPILVTIGDELSKIVIDIQPVTNVRDLLVYEHVKNITPVREVAPKLSLPLNVSVNKPFATRDVVYKLRQDLVYYENILECPWIEAPEYADVTELGKMYQLGPKHFGTASINTLPTKFTFNGSVIKTGPLLIDHTCPNTYVTKSDRYTITIFKMKYPSINRKVYGEADLYHLSLVNGSYWIGPTTNTIFIKDKTDRNAVDVVNIVITVATMILTFASADETLAKINKIIESIKA